LLDVANIYNLAMTINTPTQVIENMPTITDQIITNMPTQCYATNVRNCLLSDHYAQCITINMTVQQQNRCYIKDQECIKANIISLCFLTQNKIWIDVFQENDIQKGWDFFYSIFCPKVRRNIVSSLYLG
jgi:hypothetical protein